LGAPDVLGVGRGVYSAIILMENMVIRRKGGQSSRQASALLQERRRLQHPPFYEVVVNDLASPPRFDFLKKIGQQVVGLSNAVLDLLPVREHAQMPAQQFQGLVHYGAVVAVLADWIAVDVQDWHGLHRALDVLDKRSDHKVGTDLDPLRPLIDQSPNLYL
jgi:hypothetical protein